MKFNPTLSAGEVEIAFGGKFTAVTSFPGGEGGQGFVFKATPNGAIRVPGLYVALKIYYPGSLVERTRREVAALGRLNCEAVVKLHEAGHVNVRGQKCMFVATEFLEGDVLSSVIMRGPLGAKGAARIAVDISLAISALWTERIVHRDIKPQNIMLKRNGRAVLIDLGVARHLSLGALTTVGKTWGTEGYMSPEQANAVRQLSCKSDLFALGIVLQESVLGAHPTAHNQLALSGGGVPTTNLGLNLAPNFVALVDSLLIKTPHSRPNPDVVTAQFSKHL